MSLYTNALILLFPDKTTCNLYTFNNPRDLEVFHIMNKHLIKVVYDQQFDVIVPESYDDISLEIKNRFNNRIYL